MLEVRVVCFWRGPRGLVVVVGEEHLLGVARVGPACQVFLPVSHRPNPLVVRQLVLDKSLGNIGAHCWLHLVVHLEFDRHFPAKDCRLELV